METPNNYIWRLYIKIANFKWWKPHRIRNNIIPIKIENLKSVWSLN